MDEERRVFGLGAPRCRDEFNFLQGLFIVANNDEKMKPYIPLLSFSYWKYHTNKTFRFDLSYDFRSKCSSQGCTSLNGYNTHTLYWDGTENGFKMVFTDTLSMKCLDHAESLEENVLVLACDKTFYQPKLDSMTQYDNGCFVCRSKKKAKRISIVTICNEMNCDPTVNKYKLASFSIHMCLYCLNYGYNHGKLWICDMYTVQSLNDVIDSIYKKDHYIEKIEKKSLETTSSDHENEPNSKKSKMVTLD